MSPPFVDPALPKRIDRWRSPALGFEMPIVSYGWRGQPVLLFPTAAADFLENERFWLVKAVEPLLQQGRIRVFSIDSINRIAWMDRGLPVRESARRQALYSRYVEDEVVPFIRHVCGDGGARAITTGASFGCFHAANAFFRRPDLFGEACRQLGLPDIEGDRHSFALFDGLLFDPDHPMSYLERLDIKREFRVSEILLDETITAP